MTRRERMIERLTHCFQPQALDVRDDSERHAGHAGAQPGGETHYHVTLVSSMFKDTSRIEQHRMVNAALADEFDCGLHALQLKLSTPAE